MSDIVVKTEAEWKKELTPEQFHILREKGTEQATTGIYNNHHEHGIYRCAGCGHVYADHRDRPLCRCHKCGAMNEALRR